MWILTSKKTGTIYYLLPEKSRHTVGRTNTDLILKDDNSISRLHAYLYPTKDHVLAIDIGSKYGTFFNENIENNTPMEINKIFTLNNGERIQFGIFGNEWTISKLNICTLISAINNEERSELQKTIDALDGSVTETWNGSCTHLTMSEITVTLKVLKALVENIPIVSCNYWKTYLKNLQEGKLPPNYNEYLPKLAETFLNKEIVSFGLNDKRKTIFHGKVFIFMNKRLLDKYESIIECAGGQCRDLNKGVPKGFLVRKNVIVVQYVPSSQQSESQLSSESLQTINTIYECVTSKGRRLIPDFEIGLAIIYCSTEKYCNPDYDKASELLPNSSNLNVNNVNILAEQTPINKENTGNSVPSIEMPESAICSDFGQEQISSFNTNDSESLKEIEVLNVIENFDKNKTEEDSRTLKKTDNLKRKRSLFDDRDDEEDKIERNIKKLHINEEISQSKNLKVTDKNSQIYNLNNFLDVNKIKPNSEKTSNVEKQDSTSQQINPQKRGKIAIIRDDDENEEDSDNENDLFNFGISSAKKRKKSNNRNNESALDKDNLFDFPRNKNSDKNLSSLPSTANNLKEKQISNSKSISNQKSQFVNERSSYNKVNCGDKKQFVVDSKGWLSKSVNKIEIKSDEEEMKIDNDENIKDDKDWIKSIEGGFKVEVKPMQLVSHSFQSNNSSLESLNTTKKNFKAFVKKRNYMPQNQIAPTVTIPIRFDIVA